MGQVVRELGSTYKEVEAVNLLCYCRRKKCGGIQALNKAVEFVKYFQLSESITLSSSRQIERVIFICNSFRNQFKCSDCKSDVKNTNHLKKDI
jgi:hypothetical protein